MRGSKRRGRRTGSWELRLEVGFDPLTGRRIQRSRTIEGTAKEADAALAEWITEANRGHVGTGSRTVAQLLTEGIDQAASEGLERSTIQGYRRVARCQIEPALGKRKVHAVTAEELDRFYRALAAQGYAAGTIKQCHAVLRRVFRTAERWGWVSRSPVPQARPPMVKSIDPIPVPVVMIPQLIECARETDPILAMIVVMAADTGARRGELLALRWSKIDFAAGTVTIDSAIGEDNHSSYIKGPKNGRERTVELTPYALAALRTHRTWQIEMALRFGVGLCDDPYLFNSRTAPDGSHYRLPSNVTAGFAALRDRLGLPKSVHLHGLRHTHVTQLLDANVPIRNVSGRVGHRNSSTTMNIYAHWVKETDSLSAGAISERIWGNG